MASKSTLAKNNNMLEQLQKVLRETIIGSGFINTSCYWLSDEVN
jgi:hypothetical protein